MNHNPISYLSIAPMIQWTDRHWRFLMRQITKKTLLYTEMTMDNTLIHNKSSLESFLGHSECEHPLVLQLGGSDPNDVSEAAYLCESFAQYHEINLNCGCPSNKAIRGGFGLELMKDPDNVRKIVQQMMRKVTHTKVSVKCRIGVVDNYIDLIKLTDEDIYRNLCHFIHQVRDGGVNKIIIHARIGLLKGLSTAQNRTIPVLKYDIVQKIKYEFPEMEIILNGGIDNFEDSLIYIGQSNEIRNYEEDIESNIDNIYNWKNNPVDGVMIGREAYRNIWLFKDADSIFYKEKRDPLQNKSRLEVLHNYLDYSENFHEILQVGKFTSRVPNLTKPLHNFFTGCKSNKLYKRKLDELLKKHIKNGHCDIHFSELILNAIEDTIPEDFLNSKVI